MSNAKFCPQCGAARVAKARFCAECGAAFGEEVPSGKRTSRRSAGPRVASQPPPIPQPVLANTWQVAVGNALPDARRLFDIPATRKPRTVRSSTQESAAAPTARGKSLWGSTLWMALTQGADMVTRELQSSAPNDPNLSLRLMLASAVAVFGITLTSMPRLRSVLVRLGTVGMAVLQGQGVWPVLKQAMLDPSILSSFAPNLAAQAAGMMALLKLFKSASGKSVA
ncbi:MAG: zinc ribbon domain-containing protein [Verrucomicrobiales bacterium]|nr:zinc ribbon domain-containing protein [Verrucomicrobiales bacterium]MCP5557032.1 zinc ribbon domain-containing protein [Verrucomicrobiaceae bacterium]